MWCRACADGLHAQAVHVGLVQILEGMGAAPADSAPHTIALGSVEALEMRDAIAWRFGVALPATAVCDYPDLRVRMSASMHLKGGLHFWVEEAANTIIVACSQTAQDLAAQVVAAVQPGSRPSDTQALPASQYTPSDKHASPENTSIVDAVLCKCIADVLGAEPLTSQPLMEVCHDVSLKCRWPRYPALLAVALLLGRPALTHWGPWSCALPSALPLAWSCLPHLLLTTPHGQLWRPTLCRPWHCATSTHPLHNRW